MPNLATILKIALDGSKAPFNIMFFDPNSDGSKLLSALELTSGGAQVTAGNPLPVSVGTGITTLIGSASATHDGVVQGQLSAVAIASGGTSGFAANDTITLPGGTVLAVTTVASGVVTGVSIATPGNPVSVLPGAPVAMTSTSGAGVGTPTFNLTYSPIVVTIAGAPVNGWKVNSPGATGDLWVTDNGVTPTVNGGSSYRVFAGGGGQYGTEPGEKPGGSALKILGTVVGQPYVCRTW